MYPKIHWLTPFSFLTKQITFPMCLNPFWIQLKNRIRLKWAFPISGNAWGWDQGIPIKNAAGRPG